jgi:DNA (cytosine-5)-methyltransferase 1
MGAYYNEIDPYAAQWLRNLIAAGHIAPGDVDERSIEDVVASDLRGYTQCHFFAGIGVWSHALRLAGWSDDQPVWTGSCPCQPFSVAGTGAGITDERHLWPVWFNLIRERRPDVIFGEQVEAAIGHGWLDLVQTDLERENYSCGSVGLPAASVGAPHIRQRLWFVADAEWNKQPQKKSHRGSIGRMGRQQQPVPWDSSWQSALHKFRVMDDGSTYGMAAVNAPRNAIVPQVAQAVVEAYLES